MAHWGDCAHSSNVCPLKVGLVEYFFIHTLHSDDDPERKHLFAKVKWYQDHIRPRYFYSPIRLVCTLFESESKYSFIPVSCFLCRCALSPSVTFV